ncbi:MAG: hypothetical protein HFJ09_07265 [Lachnospiraceae bacterium]|nr:hypothetical protein [Lachnospiraceae bacterium]
MKEQIKNNLNKVTDLEKKKLLKETLNFVFSGMIDYTDYMYEKIHQRVFEELNLDEQRKKIYVTLQDKEKYDYLDDFMFPMDKSDIQKTEVTTNELREKMEQNQKIVLGTTYLKEDFLKLEKLDFNQVYDGVLVTDVKKYPIKIRLKKSDKYLHKIKMLYQYYQQNNMEWVSVNAPYLSKYYDYVLAEKVELGEEEKVMDIILSLGHLDAINYSSLIPFWNLEETYLTSANFPIATGESLRFQHTFSLDDGESVYRYIVCFEQDHDGYVIRGKHTISIVITEENMSSWPVYKFHDKNPDIHYDYEYPVYSNGNIDSFMVGFSRCQKRVIRSKAELVRLLKSYEISNEFDIININIIDNIEYKKETYNINYFIEDDIRTDVKRKQLRVTLKAKQESYLSRDLMSFLIGELQNYFPEYECVGMLAGNSESVS